MRDDGRRGNGDGDFALLCEKLLVLKNEKRVVPTFLVIDPLEMVQSKEALLVESKVSMAACEYWGDTRDPSEHLL